MDSPMSQEELHGQMHILHAEWFGTCYKTATDSISPVEYSVTNPEFAVFEEKHAGFYFILAKQHRGNSSFLLGVYGDEILQIGREVVLLTATQTKLTNCRLKPSKPSFANNQLGGSFAAIKRRAGSLAVETREIYVPVNFEQFS
jgi:hypothetical protein